MASTQRAVKHPPTQPLRSPDPPTRHAYSQSPPICPATLHPATHPPSHPPTQSRTSIHLDTRTPAHQDLLLADPDAAAPDIAAVADPCRRLALMTWVTVGGVQGCRTVAAAQRARTEADLALGGEVETACAGCCSWCRLSCCRDLRLSWLLFAARNMPRHAGADR